MTGPGVLQQKIYSPGLRAGFDEWISGFDRPVVFTNGVFDILHRGHIACLQSAAALGASLVVGVNSDASVKRLGKGTGRPFNTLEDRAVVLAALEYVDGVVSFDQDTPLELILKIKPEVLVKGGDWKVEDIVGGREVQSRGGSVHSIRFERPVSTTSLVEKIRNSASNPSS